MITVKNTMLFSLLVQIITGLISIHGIFIKLDFNDKILSDILILETIVQIIEFLFYFWFTYSFINIKNLAATRYIDWVITTPTMLLSTIMFMKYKEFKENDSHLISFEMFYVDSDNMIQRHWSLPKRLKRFPRFFQLPHFSTFISKNLLGETRFNIQSFISADFAFFKELISKDMKSKIINEPICCMTSGGQSSKNIKNIFLGNLQSLREFNSNPFLILGFIFNKIVSKAKHFLLIKLKRQKYSRYQKHIFKKLSTLKINE